MTQINAQALLERFAELEDELGAVNGERQAAIAQANADLVAQTDPNADSAGLKKRYAKVQVRDYDGDPSRVTEMDALVAYLQMLGTLVDFKKAAAVEQAK